MAKATVSFRHRALRIALPTLGRSAFGLVLALVLAGGTPAGEPPQQAIMEVVVNGHNQGPQFLSITEQNKEVYLTRTLLRALHIRDDLLASLPGDPFPLSRLPELRAEVDLDNGVLRLTIPADWFDSQRIAQTSGPREENADAIAPEPFAAYLNYDFQGAYSEESDSTNFQVPLEFGINYGQWFAFTGVTARYDEADKDDPYHFQRNMSYLSWDDAPNMRSLTIGDFYTPVQPLMSGYSLGGISWGTKFQTNPDFRYYPGLDVETLLEAQTHAELVSNGVTVKEWDLAPGVALFSDIGMYAGGDTVLVLTDAYGNRKEVAVPAFISSTLLKEGLHEYNYSLGLNRTWSKNSSEYADPLFSGFHRYGFTDNITAGIAMAASEEKVVASPSVNLAIGSHSKVNLAGSAAINGYNAYASYAGYQFNWRSLSAYATFNHFGEGYESFLTSGAPDKKAPKPPERFQTSVGASYTYPKLGSFSVGYGRDDRAEGEQKSHYSLGYRRAIINGLDLSVNYRGDMNESDDYAAFLMLRYTPLQPKEERIFDTLSYEARADNSDSTLHEVNVKKHTEMGIGWGYDLSVGHRDNRTVGDIRGQSNLQAGIVTANYAVASGGAQRAGLSYAGSVSLLNGKAYAGRPIRDNFAVVKVGREGVPVTLADNLMGHTNAEGELMVPELASYMRNRVAVAPDSLELAETIDKPEQVVFTQQRGSGSVVTFGISRFTAIEGNVFRLAAGGKRERLEAVPIELASEGAKFSSFLAQNGYFYIENVPPGDYRLTVLLYQGNCVASLKVGESAKIVQSFGELTCTVDNPTRLAEEPDVPLEEGVRQNFLLRNSDLADNPPSAVAPKPAGRTTGPTASGGAIAFMLGNSAIGNTPPRRAEATAVNLSKAKMYGVPKLSAR